MVQRRPHRGGVESAQGDVIEAHAAEPSRDDAVEDLVEGEDRWKCAPRAVDRGHAHPVERRDGEPTHREGVLGYQPTRLILAQRIHFNRR